MVCDFLPRATDLLQLSLTVEDLWSMRVVSPVLPLVSRFTSSISTDTTCAFLSEEAKDMYSSSLTTCLSYWAQLEAVPPHHSVKGAILKGTKSQSRHSLSLLLGLFFFSLFFLSCARRAALAYELNVSWQADSKLAEGGGVGEGWEGKREEEVEEGRKAPTSLVQ